MRNNHSQASDAYVVVGNPIAHSKSPLIHTEFARQTNQAMHYEAQCVAKSEFASYAQQFAQHGGKGMNITVPFKQDAYEYVDTLTPRAERAGAVNTIVFDGTHSTGHNTDGIGLLRDLTHNHNIDITNKRILVLGAGGAVRGALEPLLSHSGVHLTIANRTAHKAVKLAQMFTAINTIKGAVEGTGLDTLHTSLPYDIIINGTSSSLSGDAPVLPPHILIAEGGITYDMMYAHKPTSFVAWGVAQNARLALDGRGMLVEQAAEAFALWRGIRPDTTNALALLSRNR